MNGCGQSWARPLSPSSPPLPSPSPPLPFSSSPLPPLPLSSSPLPPLPLLPLLLLSHLHLVLLPLSSFLPFLLPLQSVTEERAGCFASIVLEPEQLLLAFWASAAFSRRSDPCMSVTQAMEWLIEERDNRTVDAPLPGQLLLGNSAEAGTSSSTTTTTKAVAGASLEASREELKDELTELFKKIRRKREFRADPQSTRSPMSTNWCWKMEAESIAILKCKRRPPRSAQSRPIERAKRNGVGACVPMTHRPECCSWSICSSPEANVADFTKGGNHTQAKEGGKESHGRTKRQRHTSHKGIKRADDDAQDSQSKGCVPHRPECSVNPGSISRNFRLLCSLTTCGRQHDLSFCGCLE
ncbi:uncharacterized protein LOC128336604 isoform X4 [Hemicordylus capensis]|uniref:uncharacterized protein LOC128336604 isoform X4 n=1 Tax=Hemicordylus capensis TaxID=884348 RepID=UPI00230230BF|nr:uncharacterized protein LOC128336604 isoform X4 [Hemicordylus capensis]